MGLRDERLRDGLSGTVTSAWLCLKGNWTRHNRIVNSREETLMTAKSTREHLIDVGLGLMHQNGYNATGLNDILKAADVPKGSFYHHFGSKEDFAAAALERYGMREREHAAAILNDATVPPLKRLRRYFSDLVKIHGQKGAIPGCMMGRFSLEIAEESPHVEKTDQRYVRPLAAHDRDGHPAGSCAKEIPCRHGCRVAGRLSAQQLGGGAIAFAG